MMIEIINLQHKYRIDRAKFKNLLRSLVDHYKLNDPEVNLAFVDTKAIRRLNREFLKKDAPTDVLSFPFGEKKSIDGKSYLGDIAISVPRAFKQCHSKTHGLEKELEDLAVHGFLHLLGFDHGKGIEEEQAKIHRLLSGRG